MWTLTLCIGFFLGLCGAKHTYDYNTQAECQQAAAAISTKALGDGYAICAPKILNKAKE